MLTKTNEYRYKRINNMAVTEYIRESPLTIKLLPKSMGTSGTRERCASTFSN